MIVGVTQIVLTNKVSFELRFESEQALKWQVEDMLGRGQDVKTDTKVGSNIVSNCHLVNPFCTTGWYQVLYCDKQLQSDIYKSAEAQHDPKGLEFSSYPFQKDNETWGVLPGVSCINTGEVHLYTE